MSGSTVISVRRDWKEQSRDFHLQYENNDPKNSLGLRCLRIVGELWFE